MRYPLGVGSITQGSSVIPSGDAINILASDGGGSAGNLRLAVLYSGGGGVATDPAWNVLYQAPFNGFHVFWRVHAGASEPPFTAFAPSGFSGSYTAAFSCLSFTDYDPIDPFGPVTSTRPHAATEGGDRYDGTSGSASTTGIFRPTASILEICCLIGVHTSGLASGSPSHNLTGGGDPQFGNFDRPVFGPGGGPEGEPSGQNMDYGITISTWVEYHFQTGDTGNRTRTISPSPANGSASFRLLVRGTVPGGHFAQV